MTAAVLALVVAALLVLAGLVLIVLPVFPGSLLVLAAMLVWSLTVRAPEGWWTLGVGGTLSVVGLVASLMLTGRRLRRREIPSRSLLVGVVCAVLGMFVVPVVGLLVGFLAGLFGAEALRLRDPRAALDSSWVAMKAMGTGLLVELGCALLAGCVLAASALVHFVTA